MTQVEVLVEQVEAHKKKDPTGYVKKNATRRLAAIACLAFEVIPQDPTRAKYRHGGSITPIIDWLQYADHQVAPLRRSVTLARPCT